MKRFKKDDTYHIIYEDLSEFFALTNPNEHQKMHSGNKYQIEEMKQDRSWRYGDEKNREEFIKVRFDAAKGKKLCSDAVKNTMASKEYKKLLEQALTYKKRVKFQDVGSRLNIPRAISGDDKYFTTYTSARKPIVKIAINICGSACVGQAEFIKVAKTAIPTIYALETAGISTEVYYCAFVDSCHDNARFSATHVKIKSAQQRFNWTTFAPVFTLGSYRESIFASWIYDENECDSGLGRPMADYHIQDHNNYDYSAVIGLNAVGPVDTVKEIFKNLGKKKGS